jgi:cellulose synthase/poly-beta-1,6-N-acetylglucosamine synthase-like glycosyltransferase
VGGYDQIQQIITGDDTLLVQRIRQSLRWRVLFSNDPESLVRSYPEENPLQVLNQRLRWGSGGLSYSPPALVFALFTFFFFVLLLLSPFFWFSGWVSNLCLAFLGLKALQEARVLQQGWKTFNLKTEWLTFGPLSIIHIPAILTFSIGGHLWGFRWKGERFRRTRRTHYTASEVAQL